MRTIIAAIFIIVMWGSVGCIEKQKANPRERVHAIWCQDKDMEKRPITFRLQYLSDKKLSVSEENELCKKAVTKD